MANGNLFGVIRRLTDMGGQINLHHFLAHSDLGSVSGEGSSSWGWVAEDGREFAVIAQSDGAAFAEVRFPIRKSALD